MKTRIEEYVVKVSRERNLPMTDEELKNVIYWLRDRAQFIDARSIGDEIRMSEADIAEYRALRKVSEMFERLLMAREERE